jgi:hypothetical protein
MEPGIAQHLVGRRRRPGTVKIAYHALNQTRGGCLVVARISRRYKDIELGAVVVPDRSAQFARRMLPAPHR